MSSVRVHIDLFGEAEREDEYSVKWFAGPSKGKCAAGKVLAARP